MKSQMLSDHFTLTEATLSQTAARLGINNTPNSNIINTMYATAVKMELLRESLGRKIIIISSWFRCSELNTAIGGSKHSQHLVGEAVDFVCPSFGDSFDVCKHIINNREFIVFDQLILEHTWVHISFAITSRKPRGQVLSLLDNKEYSVGLTDRKGNILI